MNWPMFQHVERRASRMHEMMDRLGVDAAALARDRDGQTYAEARKTCLNCPSGDACLRWLDQGQVGPGKPMFCPGLTTFEAFIGMPISRPPAP